MSAYLAAQMQEVVIMWFRRDLRLHDNAALYYALNSGYPVLPIFIFDKHILDELPPRDRRVNFIYSTLKRLNQELTKEGKGIRFFYATPKEAFAELQMQYKIMSVYANHDYEPYAQQRDASIASLIGSENLHTYKDQVIFEKNEVLKADGKPYTVFTPYSKIWKGKVTDFYLKSYPSENKLRGLIKTDKTTIPDLADMSFEEIDFKYPSLHIEENIVLNYHTTRDFPALHGTSRLSLHLRFGTASVRRLVRYALRRNEKFLNELIWREFYQSILWHFPYVVQSSFKPKYDAIAWRNNEEEFKIWCEGKTGYPIVDAGMRQLNETGWMHNRVRMIVSSFLCKHLLIDWRWGEAYFAEKLLDYELASNNGGWQWAAGCGVDAAPYFRIFNPYTQQEKFDKDFIYVKKWVPEIGTDTYPSPIVDHAFARHRCLETYKKWLS